MCNGGGGGELASPVKETVDGIKKTDTAESGAWKGSWGPNPEANMPTKDMGLGVLASDVGEIMWYEIERTYADLGADMLGATAEQRAEANRRLKEVSYSRSPKAAAEAQMIASKREQDAYNSAKSAAESEAASRRQQEQQAIDEASTASQTKKLNEENAAKARQEEAKARQEEAKARQEAALAKEAAQKNADLVNGKAESKSGATTTESGTLLDIPTNERQRRVAATQRKRTLLGG